MLFDLKTPRASDASDRIDMTANCITHSMGNGDPPRKTSSAADPHSVIFSHETHRTTNDDKRRGIAPYCPEHHLVATIINDLYD